ncbi:SDR family NAD(P)-dependent oxidoreductase [Novosphingobium sp.]|uniref:SDR family NAD(P)-dependent oxidoreductase n=1 Tax=Novosphingobium sp. TaxID=1874826 RepID=UPI002FD8A14B
MFEQTRLDGKVAIVTGGARGIGRGIAQALAGAGATVMVTGRTQTTLDETVAQINAQGGKAVAVLADVECSADNKRTVETALDLFGRIDILINNAGGTYHAKFFEITIDRFATALRFNLLSAFEMTQLAAPHMKNGTGCVINISSRSAEFGGGPNFLTYSVSKAALEQLTRTMAWELAPTIRVNAISVGVVRTDAWDVGFSMMDDDAKRMFMKQVPLQTLGSVENIGLAALYLCSDMSYVTAQIVNVDGGLRGAIM